MKKRGEELKRILILNNIGNDGEIKDERFR